MAWLTTNWPVIIGALWAIDQVLVSLLGQSTLLDTITGILKSLGGGAAPKP